MHGAAPPATEWGGAAGYRPARYGEEEWAWQDSHLHEEASLRPERSAYSDFATGPIVWKRALRSPRRDSHSHSLRAPGLSRMCLLLHHGAVRGRVPPEGLEPASPL